MKMVKKMAIVFSFFLIAAWVSSPALAADRIRLKQGTTWSSSTSYPYYVAFRNMLIKHNPNMQIAAIETGGSSTSLEAIIQGQTDFCNASSSDLAGRYVGRKGDPQKQLRMLWPNGTTPTTVFVLSSSGIKTLEGLEGKKYGLLVGSAPGSQFEAIMKSLGIHPDYFPGEPSSLTDAVSNRRIIGFAKGGAPDSKVRQISASHAITLLPVPADVVKEASKLYPGIIPIDVPAGTYPGQDKPVPTWTSTAMIATTSNLPQQVGYQIVKTVFDNPDEATAIRKRWNLTADPKNLIIHAPAPVPLQAGVVQYLKENGYTVPDALIPPEYKK